MPARRLSLFATVALCSLQALAEGSGDRLSSMAGTWDVTQRMWPAPGAEAISLPPAIAERRLVRGTYLEEVMTPATDGQPGSFSRNAFINFNPVSSKYEYTSLDTRAPERLRNVFTRMFQRRTSAARPADTIIPVAGHMTQNKTSFLVNIGRMTP